MSDVHELTVLCFTEGIEAGRQQLVMEALGHHLSGCEGLIERDFFRADDGRWVEHVVWASRADLEASAGIAEDAAVAGLFECFDTGSVSYLRGERVEPGGLGGTNGRGRAGSP